MLIQHIMNLAAMQPLMEEKHCIWYII